jgi:hypothetical protein
MPVGRFGEYLIRSGNYEKYMEKLVCSFNPSTLGGLMCRHLTNVGWDGRLYDCDFNQMLGLGVDPSCSRHIAEFDFDKIIKREVTVGEHCYGCTAGRGST